MNYTPNYNLPLFAGTDVFDAVGAVNPAMSTIDATMKSIETIAQGAEDIAQSAGVTATDAQTDATQALNLANANAGAIIRLQVAVDAVEGVADNASTQLGGLTMWKGTQAQYDAIVTKNGSTIYFVVE